MVGLGTGTPKDIIRCGSRVFFTDIGKHVFLSLILYGMGEDGFIEIVCSFQKSGFFFFSPSVVGLLRSRTTSCQGEWQLRGGNAPSDHISIANKSFAHHGCGVKGRQLRQVFKYEKQGNRTRGGKQRRTLQDSNVVSYCFKG